MDLRQLLYTIVDVGASDLHLKPGSPPFLRIDGQLKAMGEPRLEAAPVAELARALLPEGRFDELTRTGSTIGAHSASGIGRFRVAAFRQRGSIALVVHAVPDEIRSFAALGLPDTAATLVSADRGLVLFAGPTGSGVTSSLAAATHHRNTTGAVHVLCIEDPIEPLHRDQHALVSQLEVGVDTPSFASGVRAAARLDADVVTVGAIADAQTAQACLDIAASGRLVIGALRAPTVRTAIHSFCELFTIEERDVARHTLSRVLQGVVAQQLLPSRRGAGRVAATEVAVVTPKIRACIDDPARLEADLDALIADGTYHGMQTFDRSLVDLVAAREISEAVALDAAIDPDELRIALASA